MNAAEAIPGARMETATQAINIGVLLYTSGYGGADTIVLNWLRAMDPLRFRVHLFTFRPTAQHDIARFLERAAALSVSVHQLPWHRGKPLISAARELARHVNELDLRVLHCHNPYADMVGLLCRRLTPVRVVNTYHAFGESGLRLRLLEWIDIHLHPYFDCITAASESAKRDAVARGIPADRIRVLRVSTTLPLRTDSDSRKHARELLGAGPHDFVFLSIARLYAVKRYDVMMRAMATIAAEYPSAKLWIAGDGPEEQNLRALASQLGLQDCVRFLGYRNDIERLVGLADAQLLTSDIEGLPLAILEGMSAGLPIVATRVGSIPEVLRDGEAGLLVNTRRPEEVARAALRIIREQKLRCALGKAAFRSYQLLFSAEAGAESVQSLYEELVQV